MIKTLNEISYEVPEGKVLMAALVKISVESQRDKTPEEVLEQCNDLAKKMFPDEAEA